MQCLHRSHISLKPGGCSRLSPDSASMGEGKDWLMLEVNDFLLEEKVPCLALVREKYLPRALAGAQEKLQVAFFWPRIVLLSTLPLCLSENRAKNQNLHLPAAMAELQSQCIDLSCISIHMTDADWHDLCPAAGAMNKNLLERSKDRDAESKWMTGAFLLSPLFLASKHLGTLLLFYYYTFFFFKVVTHPHISACIFIFWTLYK